MRPRKTATVYGIRRVAERQGRAEDLEDPPEESLDAARAASYSHAAFPATAAEYSARVVGVVDGDTITVLLGFDQEITSASADRVRRVRRRRKPTAAATQATVQARTRDDGSGMAVPSN